MKKKYVKPQIIIENFALSETIAAGCDFKTNTMVEGECGFPLKGAMIFTSEVAGCLYHQPDNNDMICYHVPTDATNIFNS